MPFRLLIDECLSPERIQHTKARTVNFSEVIKTLNNASAFDLYRMRAAIDPNRVLDEPRWMQSVQARL